MTTRIQSALSSLKHQRLFKNTSWLLGAEISAKASRLVTIIALAAHLSMSQYGTVFLALAIHDVLRLLMRSGAGAQLIRCSDKQLPLFARNANTIQWLVCLAITGLQCLAATVIGFWYDNPDLQSLLLWMSLAYLFYPIVSVRAFLVQRNNQFRTFSLINGSCIIAENLSIALFVSLGFELYAIVIGKAVFTCCWVVCFLRVKVCHYGLGWHLPTIKHLMATSTQLFGIELLRAIRLHMDTFIAGKLLSPDLFGLYSFAKSAGIGISQSLSNAFIGALYPYLCQLNRTSTSNQTTPFTHARYFVLATAVSSAFIAQSICANWYIPFVFNIEWHHATPIVSLLCLSAIPSLWLDTYCCIQRVQGNYAMELKLRCLSLVLFALWFSVYTPNTPHSFGIAVLVASFLWLPLVALQSLYHRHFSSTYNLKSELNHD